MPQADDHDPRAGTAGATARALPLEQQVALLSGATFWRTQDLPRHGVPSITVADGPHGLRVPSGDGEQFGVGTSHPSTCFPPAVTLASTWDEELAREVGRAVGTEAGALGVDVVLGPGLNVKRHPLCGRNFEYLSEDPVLSGRLAAAVVDGIQSTGVGACLKHFVANNQEDHRLVVDVVVDERSLRELYLAGFEHAVRASRPWTVMSSYNSVNGTHVGQDPRLLTRVLRDEWGFDGLVMSDWGAVSDRVAAIAAGLDLEMPGSRGLFDDEVLAAVAAGALSREAVTTSAQRVLDLVARAPRGTPGADLPVDEHDALALRVAAEGTVLLANDGTLPLDGTERVALLGAFAEHPRYQGSGSSLVNPTRVTTALDAFRDRGLDVVHEPGYDPAAVDGDDPALLAAAVAAAAAADVAVVMVGLPPAAESEGFDRDHLRLPAQHDQLVRAVSAVNPRTVVALSNGAPVLLPWRDDVAAIVESYLGGQASGGALAAVLYGDVPPAGRLAETFPAALTDVAADPWFPGAPRQVQYREGLAVGYRHHVTADVTPLFPFGHGLSYTRFSWTDAAVDRNELAPGEGCTVRVTVTNDGDRAGADVVQVYVADRTGVVQRPDRALAGWAKVRLEPGEAREVAVLVPARALAFYDVDAADWRTPSGRHELLVCRSSADVVHRLEIEVVGGVASAPEPADAPAVALDDAFFARRLGRPVPPVPAARPFSRESTVDEFAATVVGRLLRRPVLAASRRGTDGEDPTSRAMIERSIGQLPLRSVAMFSRGTIRLPLVDALVAIANRRPPALLAALRRALPRR